MFNFERIAFQFSSQAQSERESRLCCRFGRLRLGGKSWREFSRRAGSTTFQEWAKSSQPADPDLQAVQSQSPRIFKGLHLPQLLDTTITLFSAGFVELHRFHEVIKSTALGAQQSQ